MTDFMSSDLIQITLRDHGYQRLESADEAWSLFWYSGELRPAALSQLGGMAPHQRINKLPGSAELTDKSRLWLSFERMRQRQAAAYDFMPMTFVLPEDAEAYEEHLRERFDEGDTSAWILKPALGARGWVMPSQPSPGPWCPFRPRAAVSPRRRGARWVRKGAPL